MGSVHLFHDSDFGHLQAAQDLQAAAESLQALSGAWYRVAADAAQSGERTISREQHAQLIGTLHDVAAAYARCARACRQASATVAPILSEEAAAL